MSDVHVAKIRRFKSCTIIRTSLIKGDRSRGASLARADSWPILPSSKIPRSKAPAAAALSMTFGLAAVAGGGSRLSTKSTASLSAALENMTRTGLNLGVASFACWHNHFSTFSNLGLDTTWNGSETEHSVAPLLPAVDRKLIHKNLARSYSGYSLSSSYSPQG